jgi:hypothetical protein
MRKALGAMTRYVTPQAYSAPVPRWLGMRRAVVVTVGRRGTGCADTSSTMAARTTSQRGDA